MGGGRRLGWGPTGAAGTQLHLRACGHLQPPGAGHETQLLRLTSYTAAGCAVPSNRPKEVAPVLPRDWLLSDFCRRERRPLTQSGWGPRATPRCSLHPGALGHHLPGAAPAPRGKTWVLGKGEGKNLLLTQPRCTHRTGTDTQNSCSVNTSWGWLGKNV